MLILKLYSLLTCRSAIIHFTWAKHVQTRHVMQDTVNSKLYELFLYLLWLGLMVRSRRK